jgi:hypothetical protein
MSFMKLILLLASHFKQGSRDGEDRENTRIEL